MKNFLKEAGVLLLAAVMIISVLPTVMADTTWVGYTDGHTENSFKWSDGAPWTMAIELSDPELAPYRGQLLCEVRFSCGSDDYGFFAEDYEIYYATGVLPDLSTLTPIATGTASDTGWTAVVVPGQLIPASGSAFVIVRFVTSAGHPAGFDYGSSDLRGGHYLNYGSTSDWINLQDLGFLAVWGLEAGIATAPATVIFSQPPMPDDTSGSAYFSDAGWAPGRIHDNFWGITEDIYDVHWWGLFVYGSSQEPTPGDEFEILFCADNGGIPDYSSPTAVFTGSIDSEIICTGTGVYYWGYELYYMEMDLPSPVSMSNGWVSFFKTTVTDQYFTIMESLIGDDHSFYNGGAILTNDFAFELTNGESELSVDVDIKPGSCPNPINTKSKGVISVAICGTDTLDVTTIDPNTVQLEGVSPVHLAYEDVATPFIGELCDCHELTGDGYLDMVFKFKTQEVVAALGDVNDRKVLILTISGCLLDGTPFEGYDCVWIIDK